MPIFKYKGYAPGGAETVGTIEADGPKDAAVKIRQLGMYPRDITAVQSTASSLRGFGRSWSLGNRRISTDELSALTRQLSVLVRAGVPLVEALRAQTEEASGATRTMLVALREQVISGASFSRAIENHKDVFPDFYRSMVAAAEESGTLDEVLDRIADFLQENERMRARVRTATIYPLFLFVVATAVTFILFTFVVPKIVTIFEDTKQSLPLATVILIGITGAFVHFKWYMIAAAAAALYGARHAMQRWRIGMHKLLMRPFSSLYFARLTRILSFLLAGGLPVLRALELAGSATGNAWLALEVKQAAGRVSEGSSIANALQGLSPVLRELISTGEKSGMLPEVLARAADSYEARFDQLTQRLLAGLGPAIVLIMAIVVGFIVMAVLLPMFELNQLIR